MKKLYIVLMLISLLSIVFWLWMNAHECLIIYTGGPDVTWSTDTKHGELNVIQTHGFNISCIK